MKKLYLNDLQELQCLINRINNEIDIFKHVSEFLPNSLIKEINKFNDKVNDEINRRFDEEI